MLKEMAQEGATLSEILAPQGKEPDKRVTDPPIAGSIYWDADSDSAVWGTGTRHGAAVELGSSRHYQTANVSFYWEREGRWWGASYGLIDHPATRAKPFLRPAFQQVMSEWHVFAERHMPH
jgi:hypothetical protein